MFLKNRLFNIAILFFLSLTILLVSIIFSPFYSNTKTNLNITEGVVVEKGFNISKISPILTSNVSIEKSISQLIFEPLYRLDTNGNIVNVLAEKVRVSDDKKKITVSILKNIKFSDGKLLTTSDIFATFNVLKSLEEDSAYVLNAKNTSINVIDDYNLEFESTEFSPTTIEDLTFGILPKHILDDDNPQTFLFHKINKTEPIGTGPFVYNNSNESGVNLTKNKYYRSQIGLDSVYIKYFFSEADLVDALLNAQIDLTSSLKNTIIDTDVNAFLTKYVSEPLLNRYWAVYFNLGTNENITDKESIQAKIRQNKSIRQAISITIDRDEIAKAIYSNVSPMYNMYPASSPINSDYTFVKKKISDAITLLENDGWKVDARDGIRRKENMKLSLRLSVLDNQEKNSIAKVITSNLRQIGIEVITLSYSPEDLVNSVIQPRNFDMLLYGVETSFDYDRYRLWNSQEIAETGLNLASYSSTDTILDPLSKKTVAKSDDLLIRGRLETDPNKRIDSYRLLRDLIDSDVPAIFLYQPSTYIIANKRISGINISEISTPEDRYTSISAWKIK